MNRTALAVALALSSTFAAAATPRAQPDEPQSQCVTTTQIRSTKALDDQTIIFTMTNGYQWKNTLPRKCPRLKFNDSFSYKLSGTRLCDLDVITVLERPFGEIQGPTCGLGKFEKYVPPPKPAKA